MTEDQAAHYLAAMIDGEGHVTRTGTVRRVGVTNCDPDLIAAVCECYDVLEIRYTVRPKRRYKVTHTPCFDVMVESRAGLQTIWDRVPIRSSRKRQRLQEIVDSYTAAARPDPSVLREMYVERRMSAARIAAVLAAHPQQVLRWLRRDGVERRTPQEAALCRATREAG